MVYDNLGRLLSRTCPDAGTEYFVYSPAGLIAYMLPGSVLLVQEGG
jgi:hypothetical protein